MQKPIHYRKNIPFFHNKTALEFRQDPYERYDPMVLRQSMLHLTDSLGGAYPMQPVKDYIQSNCSAEHLNNILEIGCGVGRLIGDIASMYSEVSCWGIDYSYQMLKRAKEVWVDNKSIELDLSTYGFLEGLRISRRSLTNLNFGLAKCEDLPFEDDSQDLVLSSFLLDRLSDPIQGLKEMKRVLRENGKLILVSPLNFNTSKNWSHLYPDDKLRQEIEAIGLKVLDWNDDMVIKEPMDKRRNCITWNCVAMVLS